MKKLLTIGLLWLWAGIASSQVTNYSTNRLYSSENTSQGWTQWTSEQTCDTPITIDWTNETVTVEGNATQSYNLLYQDDAYTDASGNEVCSYRLVDQYGDRGEMKMTTSDNGDTQIVIEFQDVRWCYDVTVSAPQDLDVTPTPMMQWMCMAETK
ncbi:MAG: hypothetical protein MJZ74_09330 [Muribaculaceae bacterium]|nr:hypothetical protein [Muribaculaceae bacterium]